MQLLRESEQLTEHNRNEYQKLLEDMYECTDKYHIIKEWYDSYRFGNVDIYCPWMLFVIVPN